MNNFKDIITSNEYINLLLDAASKHLETEKETGFSTFNLDKDIFHSRSILGSYGGVDLPDVFEAYHHFKTVDSTVPLAKKRYALRVPFTARTPEEFYNSNIRLNNLTDKITIFTDIVQTEILHFHPTKASSEQECSNMVFPSVMKYYEEDDCHYGDLFAIYNIFLTGENPIQTTAGINNTEDLEIIALSVQHKTKFDEESLSKINNTLKQMSVRTNNYYCTAIDLDLETFFTFLGEKILDIYLADFKKAKKDNNWCGLEGTRQVAKLIRDTGFYNATVFQYKDGQIKYNNKEMRKFEMP